MNPYKASTQGTDYVLQELKIFSCYGKDALCGLSFPVGANYLEKQQHLEVAYAEVAIFIDLFRNKSHAFITFSEIFKVLRNIRGTLKNLEKGLVLDDIEFLELKGFCLKTLELLRLYSEYEIKLVSVYLENCEAVISLLNPDSSIVSSFYVHEKYSDKLKELRKRKRELEFSIIREANEGLKAVLRNERALIVEQERAEEFEVRVYLSSEVRKHLDSLRANTVAIGHLELLCAKSELAIRFNAVCPKLVPNKIKMVEGRHVELEAFLANSGKGFTGVDIELELGCTVLTGANMGGKSIALATVAMNIELAHLGFYVFAHELELPVLDFVFMTGSEISGHDFGLSSFGSEIVSLNQVIELTKSGRGFISCDEFARSTNPYEGKRFVQALVDYFNSGQSFSLISTHYDGITNSGNCYQVKGLKNEILTSTISLSNISNFMDYHLIKVSEGISVPKDALNISILLKLSPDFLQILEKYYKIP